MKKLSVFGILLFATISLVAQQKNVLFIAVDDLKPLLSSYGDEIAQTPNFDRLSAMGTTFTNSHCQQAVCGPSRASLLTGVYPDLTEVWDLKTLMRDKNPNILTLPQHFKNNGYTTVGTGKIYDPRSVDKGYDKVSWTVPYIMPSVDDADDDVALGTYLSDEHLKEFEQIKKQGEAQGLDKGKLNNFIRESFKPSTESADVADDAYLDGMIANVAVDQLGKLANGKNPFFLAVGFKKPHLPFVAPKKYWDLYDREKMPIEPFQEHAANTIDLPYHTFGELKSYTDIPEALVNDKVSMDKQKKLIHGYYACVSYIDAQLGKILDALDANDLTRNTAIVLWGDHGWHLGDHGLWCKHSNFEQATRAPLILVDPMGKKGQLNESPTGFVDIFPTLCDLTGIEKPAHLQGESLKPIVVDGEKSVNDFAISQYPRAKHMGYSLRNERYRFTAWFKDGNTEEGATILFSELYDYKKDPQERVNVVNQNPTVADGMKAQLLDFLKTLNQEKKSFKKLTQEKKETKEVKVGKTESSGSNLLKDGGFEEGGKGWNTFGDNKAEFVAENPYSGSMAVKLPTTKSGAIQKLALKPNTNYMLSAWLKSSNGEKVILSVKDHGADEVKTEYSGNEYNQVKLTFKTGDDASEAKIRFMKFNNAQTGPAWADEFVLIELKTDGLGLKTILEKNFDTQQVFVGATIAEHQLGTFVQDILTSNFSYSVPENAAKQSRVHPEPGVWKWEGIDAIVKMAKENDITLRLHGPISPQASKWAKADNRKPAELEKVMTEYMTEQCKRFNGHANIKWMDVVNETVERDGSWFGPKPGEEDWENPWTIIGTDSDKNSTPSYIRQAFEIANKYAPDISLVYNQHGGLEPVMWDRVKETILYLRSKGLRVDGIGWQAHINDDESLPFEQSQLDYFSELIDWAHANKLDFHVTEIDYRLKENVGEKGQKKQADAYANILRVLLSKRNQGVVTYNTWGIVDGVGKLADRIPFIFNEDGSPKPAYYAIKDVLENPDSELVIMKGAALLDESFDNGIAGKWITIGQNKPVAVSGQGVNNSPCVAMNGDKSGLKYTLNNLTANSTYEIEVWVKGDNEIKTGIKIDGYGGEALVQRVKGNGKFQKATLSFVTGKTSTSAELVINRWDGTEGGTVLVDDVRLFKVNQ